MAGILAKCAVSASAASVLVLLEVVPAGGVETGVGLYPKGFVGFMSGVVPPQPGLYLNDTYYFYDGSVGASVRQGLEEFNAKATMNADYLTGTYVSDLKFLGGTYGASVALNYAWNDLDASLNTPVGGAFVTLKNNAFGDSIYTPVILGWHEGFYHWSIQLPVYAPTGQYSLRGLSIGRNVWGFLPTFSFTYYDPINNFDISAAFVYTTMSNNNTTNYQSGDLMNLDWAAGKHLGPGGEWELGVAGNVVQQIGPDNGTGAKLGPLKAESVGIGPSLSYSSVFGSIPVSFGAKWEHDVNARNTFRGNVVTASATVVF